MSEKYLTKDGLAYFLSKLDSRFAGKTHVHGNITNDGKLNGGANKVVVTDGNKFISVSTISTTELGYLSGVTSNIQTQLNSKAASSSLSNYLPLTGGTLSGSSAGILVLKRTNSAGGAFADYKNKNQNAKFWRVGMENDDTFSFFYTSNTGSNFIREIEIGTDGNIILNNDKALKSRNSSSGIFQLIRLNSNNNVVINGDNSGGTFIGGNSLSPVTTSDLGSSSYKWRNLYLSGNLSDGTNSIAVADIASTTYVNNAISSSITTVLNTPV